MANKKHSNDEMYDGSMRTLYRIVNAKAAGVSDRDKIMAAAKVIDGINKRKELDVMTKMKDTAEKIEVYEKLKAGYGRYNTIKDAGTTDRRVTEGASVVSDGAAPETKTVDVMSKQN